MNKRDLMGRWVPGCSSLVLYFFVFRQTLSSSPFCLPLAGHRCTMRLLMGGTSAPWPWWTLALRSMSLTRRAALPCTTVPPPRPSAGLNISPLEHLERFSFIWFTSQQFRKHSFCLVSELVWHQNIFCTFSELIVIFPAIIRTTKMRQRNRTCESPLLRSRRDHLTVLNEYFSFCCQLLGASIGQWRWSVNGQLEGLQCCSLCSLPWQQTEPGVGGLCTHRGCQ